MTEPLSTSPPREARNGWVLVAGFFVALVVSLSIHVVMLQIMNVPYPDRSAVPATAKFVNAWFSILALLVVCRLAREKLERLGPVGGSLALLVLYAMLKEALLRTIVMNGVVTTAWVYSAVSALPRLAGFLLVAGAVVLGGRLLRKSWQLAVYSLALAGASFFGVEPLLGAASGSILKSISYLAHEEIYAVPYGWQVIVPAYLTYAEPVLATFFLAWLVWPHLSPRFWFTQFVLLVTLMKGALLSLFLFSPYLPHDLPTALASESQFTFEALALCALVILTWRLAVSKRPGQA